MSDDTQIPSEATSKQKAKNTKFTHLKKTTQVATSNHSNVIIGVIVVMAIIFFAAFMLWPSHALNKTQKPLPEANVDNSNIIAENAERLKALQAGTQTQPTQPDEPLAPAFHQTQKESKAMKTRQSAPTQMFAEAGNASQRTQNQDINATGQGTVLAGQGKFAKFANTQNAGYSTVSATQIAHPRYTIVQGEFIHGVLETAINSDLPGMVRAVVTQPVYAYLGEKPLIPAGSRIVGQYAAMPSNGQASTRVFVIWDRIITPRGISIMINSSGTDALGRAGLGADAVDHHFFKMFGTAALLSVMSATTATAGVSSTTQPNSANLYQQSISQALQQGSQQSLNSNLNIKPTIHIYQGHAINVFVARDLSLYAVLGEVDDAQSSQTQQNGWGFIK